MKPFLVTATIILVFLSCNKDSSSKRFEPYYKVAINGKPENVYACGSSDYVCQFLRDTAMFVGIGCGGESAGFYLKGNITDGTYNLNNINQAFYSSNQTGSYSTNYINTGALTITTGNVNGTTTLKGSFEFKGIDTTTGDTLTFTNGSFLMKKVQY
jgi:hypothetical protein